MGILHDAKNLVFYWATNASPAEKFSLLIPTVIIVFLIKKLFALLDTYLEEKVKNYESGAQNVVDKSKVQWWKEYDENKIVSIDCEFVDFINGNNGYIKKLASVAICSYKGINIYDKLVHHARGTFLVNSNTKRINGFVENSFEKGEPFAKIQQEVNILLRDKLVITVDGKSDFSKLKLPMNEFDIFDLQDVYSYTKPGDKRPQPHSLRSIYNHYFGINIHQGVHNASSDAKATMIIFRNCYQEEYKEGGSNWPEGRNDIKRLK